MELNVKELVAEAAPEGERDEMMEVANEGMKVASQEVMEAISASDPDALLVALRNLIRMSKY